MKPTSSTSKLPGVIGVARTMHQSLTTRFKFVWDPLASNFDEIYIASTFLNPAYRGLLEDTQLTLAKDYLSDLMKEDNHVDIGTVDTDGVEEMQGTEESTIELNESTDEPPLKRFKHLDRVSELLRKKEDAEKEAGPQQITKEEEEIERYSKCRPTNDEMKLDPIVYWVNVSHVYPNLSPVACDILAVPASSAPVERAFSISGESSRGRRNRLVDHNLERETLMRKNKKYI